MRGEAFGIFGGAEVLKARFTGEGPGIFVIRAKSFAAEPSGGAPAAVVASPAPDTGATNGAKILARHVEERTGVFRGANWHERETHEMFGIAFAGHPNLIPLLLPDGFDGHPLRKDFVLAARVAKAWPGAKEPGEGREGAPSRRKTLPPGVPDGWGTT